MRRENKTIEWNANESLPQQGGVSVVHDKPLFLSPEALKNTFVNTPHSLFIFFSS